MERRTARLERRGRLLGLIAIQVAFVMAIVGVWTWALTSWPLFDYWVFPSSLPTYGLFGLAASIVLWSLLARQKGAELATLIVGVMVVVAGVGLGISPPVTPGGQSGWCKTVFGNVGLHGDDREDCFDARAARADDVAIVLSFGLIVCAIGSFLVTHDGTPWPHPRPGNSASAETVHS
jgi:hypothetical protein